MTIRSYTDRDGHEWSAWVVIPAPDSIAYQERFRDGWVCFERAGGSARSRIPLSEVPPAWESLPDDRLDLLRRVAEMTSSSRSTAQRSADAAREQVEARPRASTSDPARATNGDAED
jgi:hypothetical protein